MDADGTSLDSSRNGFCYQLTSVHKKWLQDFQSLLKTFCVYSKIGPARKGGLKDFGDGYGEYSSQDSYRLSLSQVDSIKLAKLVKFSRLTNFSNKMVAYNVKPKWNKVVSIQDDGVSDKVYCCTVVGSKSFSIGVGIVTGNCGEVLLQSKQMCNLSENIAKPNDTRETLLQKQRLATILGTYQSTLTNFAYISEEWKRNCEDERLLGVSITGQWDCEAVRDPELQRELRQVTIDTNIEYAARFGINPSTATTVVKPSGTVSQAFNCASGMHRRKAPYYIRRIRISATDALFKMLRDQGVPYHPEVGQTTENATTFVLDFPVKSPDNALYEKDYTALEQLNYWKQVKQNYTEHNPSITVHVGDDEWIQVVNWLYDNWDIVGGLAFLPRDNHIYKLAPYEPISEEEYQRRMDLFPDIDFSQLYLYEYEDGTDNKREYACTGDSCEIM
jgi:uncharacterized membrane protein